MTQYILFSFKWSRRSHWTGNIHILGRILCPLWKLLPNITWVQLPLGTLLFVTFVHGIDDKATCFQKLTLQNWILEKWIFIQNFILKWNWYQLHFHVKSRSLLAFIHSRLPFCSDRLHLCFAITKISAHIAPNGWAVLEIWLHGPW